MYKKTIAIIQARMGSERLPNKAMAEINGRPILRWVINRIRAVNLIDIPLIDEIIVATTNTEKDDIIVEYCKRCEVKCFRGSENNVLQRYYDCALRTDAEWILRVTADCPLIDPLMVYGLLTKAPRLDYQALAINQRRMPLGYDAELFSFRELKRVYENYGADEHVSTFMRGKGEDYLDHGTDFTFHGVKFDVDTPNDLEKVRKYASFL